MTAMVNELNQFFRVIERAHSLILDGRLSG